MLFKPGKLSQFSRAVGWTLMCLGLLVVVFSNKIVFPGLERLVGIETIVGRENVVYQPDGGYLFTNPGAMMRWILSVAAVGIVVGASGIWLLLRARRSLHDA
jgi:hypothetical protein